MVRERGKENENDNENENEMKKSTNLRRRFGLEFQKFPDERGPPPEDKG
jgi:hypothetical protein